MPSCFSSACFCHNHSSLLALCVLARFPFPLSTLQVVSRLFVFTMVALVASQRDEGSAVGVRRPRTESCRKPRSRSYPSVKSCFQDICSSLVLPTSNGLSDGKIVSSENGSPPREVFRECEGSAYVDTGAISCTVERSLWERERKDNKDFCVGKSSGEMNRQVESENHTAFQRIADGQRGDWKMFNRRDISGDEWLPDKDPARTGKFRRDADGVFEKPFSREDSRRAGSPEHERMKKPEKVWKENPDRNYKDSGYRNNFDHSLNDFGYRRRGDHFLKDSGYRDKGDHSKDFGHRGRGDHFSKDSGYRDRRESSRNDYGDRSSSREYSRDRDYQKFKRLSDEKERYWKSVDTQERRDPMEKQRGYTHERSAAESYNSQGGREWKSYDKVSGHRPPENGFDHRRKLPSENVLDHRNDKSPTQHRPTKLKLKVGGVTHTILPDGGRLSEVRKLPDTGRLKVSEVAGLTVKKPSLSVPAVTEPNKRRQRLILQENSDDDDDDVPPRPEEQVPEYPCNDVMAANAFNVESSFSVKETSREESFSLMPGLVAPKPSEADDISSFPLQAVRKSSRIPKKRVLDGDEQDDSEPKRRGRRKVEQDSDDQYHVEDDEGEEVAVGDDLDNIFWERTTGKRRKRKRSESDSSAGEIKKEVPLTARQRSLQSSKEGGDADIGASLIEFPEGLTHSFAKKKKEVLSEAEQQLKKEEAARKRRQQVEKNAKEIQAVAIQKILGQDSQRKKREDKIQKHREELEQGKKAAAMAIPLNSIRWVMGPSGTVVSFSQDIELPKIFSGPCSYPKEREVCAAPSCTNTYKYRDSKSSLPLCSLQCYRAVQKLPQAASAH